MQMRGAGRGVMYECAGKIGWWDVLLARLICSWERRNDRA